MSEQHHQKEECAETGENQLSRTEVVREIIGEMDDIYRELGRRLDTCAVVTEAVRGDALRRCAGRSRALSGEAADASPECSLEEAFARAGYDPKVRRLEVLRDRLLNDYTHLGRQIDRLDRLFPSA